MSKEIRVILFICFVSLSSCKNKNSAQQFGGLGDWFLSSYSIGEAYDIDKDGVFHLNLLKEISCENKEVLKFEATGVISSTGSYNPRLNMSKIKAGNAYHFDIECSKGVIGFATSFVQTSKNQFKFNDREYTITNDSFTQVLTDAVNIYNDSLTDIIETKDLVLIYSKL